MCQNGCPRVGIAPEDLGEVAKTFELYQNFPNPFNPTTNIEFALTKASDIKLEIFNVVGQKVQTLVSSQMQPGIYSVTWDGRDSRGNSVVSGVYLYRLVAGNTVQTKKMILLK